MRNRFATRWCLALVCAGCSGAPSNAPTPSTETLRAEAVNPRFVALAAGEPAGAPLVRQGGAWVATGSVHSLRVESDGSWSYRATRSTKSKQRVEGTPLRLSASRIERGEMRSTNPRARAGDHSRQVAFERGVAVERIDWSEGGVEQSWTFDAPPVDPRDPAQASGGTLPPLDLVVRVPVSGHDFVGEGSEGVRFRDPSSQTIVRYGVATWVDAAGERATVLPRYRDGEIVLTVPASVVDGARYPAVLDPQISTELEIDNPAITPGNARVDGMAYDPVHNQYLAVWRNSGIWAQRLTYAGGTSTPVAVGAKILVASLPVGGTGTELTGSSAYFDGTNYQVVWTGDNLSVTGIWARRLNSGGSWIEGAPVSIDASATESCATARTKLGVAVIVYWRNPSNVYAQGIAGGVASGSAFFVGSGFFPTVGTDGYGFLVVTGSTSHAPHGALSPYLVDAGLTSASPLPAFTTNGTNPSISYGAGQWIVTWEDESIRGPGMTGLMGSYITGGVEAPFSISPAFPSDSRSPSTVFDGKSFITSYRYNGTGVMVQITPGTTPPPITAQTMVVNPSIDAVASVSDGNGHVVYALTTLDLSSQNEAFAGGWSSGVDGAPCLTSADCDHGHCIPNSPAGTGSTCCATACTGDTCDVAECSSGTTCTTHTVTSGQCAAYSSCQGTAAGCTPPADTDGDNLPDTWETSNNGFGQHYVDANCDGTWESTEPLLTGASSTTPDVYVTYDYMGLGLDDWSCTSGPDCTALGGFHRGESCVGGKCVYTSCTTNNDCTDGAHTACTLPTDCAAGSYCDTVTTHQCQRGAWHAGEQCLVNGSVTLARPLGTPCGGAGCACYHTHDPEAIAPGAIQKVVDSYSTHGVNLHVTRGHAQPHSHVVSFRADTSMDSLCEGASGSSVGPGQYAVSLYDLKGIYLPANTKSFMHYGLFAHYVGCDTSSHCTPVAAGGTGDCPYATNPDGTPKNIPAQGQTGLAEVSGNDFVVALGGAVNDSAFVPGVLSTAGYSVVGATFMHELGHNLGLRHDGHADRPCPGGTGCTGGDVCTDLHDGEGQVCHQVTAGMTGVEQPNYKPNYISLMNYRYEPNGIQSSNVINTAGAASPPTPGSATADATLNRLDYSSQVLPTGGPTIGMLVENNLSDSAGLGAVGDTHFPGQQLLFTYKDGLCDSAWKTMPATGSVDWYSYNLTYGASGVAADVDANVGVGICAGSPSDTLNGRADWGNFVYAFQCTSPFDDGFAPVANYPQEPDVPSLSGAPRGQTCGQVGCLGPAPPVAANPSCSSGQGCANPVPVKLDIRPQAQNNWVVQNDANQWSGPATVSYTGGGCTVCGGAYGCFSSNTSSFTDPTPAGSVVTGIAVQLSGVDCTNGGTLYVYYDGIYLGSTSEPQNCACGSCQTYPWVIYYGGTLPLPGWVQGGTNTVSIVSSNGGQTCLHATSVYTYSWRTVPVVVYGSPLLDVSTINGAAMTLGNATPVFTPVTSVDLDGDGYKDLQASFVDGNIGLTSSSTQATVNGTANLPLGGAINFSGTDVVTMVASPVANVACSAAGYSGANGCWYKSALGQTCNSVCGNRGGFNAAASTHSGNKIGKGFFPLKANGSNWMSVECSSTDNNTDWGATGAAPDGTFSHPACYLSCSCNN